jgi:hypothetical protein
LFTAHDKISIYKNKKRRKVDIRNTKEVSKNARENVKENLKELKVSD